MPVIDGWMLQWYANVPAVGNSRFTVALTVLPTFSGAPCVSKITLCCTAWNVKKTLSCAGIDTAAGSKVIAAVAVTRCA